MPLMPMPPMPTKCTWRVLPSMRGRSTSSNTRVTMTAAGVGSRATSAPRRRSTVGVPGHCASATIRSASTRAGPDRFAAAPRRRPVAARRLRVLALVVVGAPSAAESESPPLPAAAISASVVAPARQTTTSASRELPSHVEQERLDVRPKPPPADRPVRTISTSRSPSGG